MMMQNVQRGRMPPAERAKYGLGMPFAQTDVKAFTPAQRAKYGLSDETSGELPEHCVEELEREKRLAQLLLKFSKSNSRKRKSSYDLGPPPAKKDAEVKETQEEGNNMDTGKEEKQQSFDGLGLPFPSKRPAEPILPEAAFGLDSTDGFAVGDTATSQIHYGQFTLQALPLANGSATSKDEPETIQLEESSDPMHF